MSEVEVKQKVMVEGEEDKFEVIVVKAEPTDEVEKRKEEFWKKSGKVKKYNKL